jgi:hypothetical protein
LIAQKLINEIYTKVKIKIIKCDDWWTLSSPMYYTFLFKIQKFSLFHNIFY